MSVSQRISPRWGEAGQRLTADVITCVDETGNACIFVTYFVDSLDGMSNMNRVCRQKKKMFGIVIEIGTSNPKLGKSTKIPQKISSSDATRPRKG